MNNVSGFGTSITLVALQTFPVGFEVTQFADDVDPLVAEEIESTGFEMLYDGTLFPYDKAAPVKLSIGVIAGSDDDINMKIMLQARKASVSILPFPDTTSCIIVYPDGGLITLSNGSILSGPLVDGIQMAGRKKGNVYTFAFGTFAGAQNPVQIISSIATAALGFL